MNKYETLLQETAENQISIDENYHFNSNFSGLYIDGNIALSDSLRTTTEKTCVLAEELGHHHTTFGDILDLSDAGNRKQERRARLWAYHRAFDLVDLISAYKHGCRNRFEIAEYLEVTEHFLEDAINTYSEKYGCYTKVGKYIICFEPLGILEIYEEDFA